MLVINQIYIDVISVTAARIHLHKPGVMQYCVHFTSNVASYIATGSGVENRTMEESHPERQFNITEHNDYFVKSHDTHCCTFHKI